MGIVSNDLIKISDYITSDGYKRICNENLGVRHIQCIEEFESLCSDEVGVYLGHVDINQLIYSGFSLEGKRIYSSNVPIHKPNLIPIPKPFLRTKKEMAFAIEKNRSVPKDKLCAYIPHICIHPIEKEIFEVAAKKLDFISFHLQASYWDILPVIARYKYVICPPSVTCDNRFAWAALYLGTIPIVLKKRGYDSFSPLPILVIQQWSDLTEDKLIKRAELLEKQVFDYDKLTMSYWENLIVEDVKRLNNG